MYQAGTVPFCNFYVKNCYNYTFGHLVTYCLQMDHDTSPTTNPNFILCNGFFS